MISRDEIEDDKAEQAVITGEKSAPTNWSAVVVSVAGYICFAFCFACCAGVFK